MLAAMPIKRTTARRKPSNRQSPIDGYPVRRIDRVKSRIDPYFACSQQGRLVVSRHPFVFASILAPSLLSCIYVL